MINKLTFALFLSMVFITPAFAQNETPQWEIFGGGTWLRANISPNLTQFGVAHINLVGWNASATENVNSWFGGTIDFSGSLDRPIVTVPANSFGPGLPPTSLKLANDVNAAVYTFMGGPTFSIRRGSGRFVPFARFLMGDVNARASTTSAGTVLIGASEKISSNRFAVAAGGGMDIRLSRLLAVRGTADWVHTTFPDFIADRQDSLRVSGGLVLRLGAKP